MNKTYKKETYHLLQSSLFWDININDIDIDLNARFIIERVISRGTLKNWKTILAFYGGNRVRNEVVSIRSLDPKSLSYLSVFFNIKKSKFRCYLAISPFDTCF